MFLLLLCLLYIGRGEFDGASYEGGNCGFVEDKDLDGFFPLDVCIVDYTAGTYKSRTYECTMSSSGSYDIEVYTYYGDNCNGTVAFQRGVLGEGNPAFNCGNGNSTEYDDCYIEYKQYSTCDDGWEQSSYSTKYIIVGACVASSANNSYSRCNPDDNDKKVEYVLFNDDQCCDLSYIYTGDDGPRFTQYDISTGCQSDNTYIDPDSWMCLIPDAAITDDNIFTDNTDKECTDDSNKLYIIYGVIITIIINVII